jgi:hypothetical protein
LKAFFLKSLPGIRLGMTCLRIPEAPNKYGAGGPGSLPRCRSEATFLSDSSIPHSAARAVLVVWKTETIYFTASERNLKPQTSIVTHLLRIFKKQNKYKIQNQKCKRLCAGPDDDAKWQQKTHKDTDNFRHVDR